MKLFRFFVAFTLVCFAPLPISRAVSPPPDGGYPDGNTAEGQKALFSLTTGGFNTAIGWLSLESNSTGQFNTGVGAATLALNTADKNTATGAGALLSNVTGTHNTADGAFALFNNSTGSQNTADGTFALFDNTVGSVNTATGDSALTNNVTGSFNTATGVNALLFNTTGSDNTAIGHTALFNNTTGGSNTAIGEGAGFNATTGSGNIYIGAGMGGTAGENNNTYIGNINSTTVSGGGADYVTVDLTTGLIGHLSSSRRYKEYIKSMNNASEILYRLKPVTYRYKQEIDHTQTPAFGLIAEDVAEVNPALVAHDAKGQPESVHYEMVNAMLLNEFLKEHRRNEQQRKDFEAALARQQKQIDALSAGLQKVSAQLEVSKTAPQTVLNDQ
jgi:hypothetical protein